MIIASVPHTASRFVQSLLGPGIGNFHVYQGENLTEIRKHDVIVVPLRHPMSVAQSWKDRGKPIVSHEKHEPMAAMFRTLIREIAPLGPVYLPVDVPNRMDYLAKLSERTGRLYYTDWTPIKDSNPHVEIEEPDVAAVNELLAEPFFERFGYR